MLQGTGFRRIYAYMLSLCVHLCVCVYVCLAVTIAIAIRMQGHRLRMRDKKMQIGLLLTAVGTLIFGFGDSLLFGLLLSYKSGMNERFL